MANRPEDAADPDSDGGVRSISERRTSARREANAGYEQRRQRLLEAAAEVFKEKGFRGTSVNDIAARMGSDRATIYYYYGSKRDIYLDLIRQAVEEIVVITETAARDDRPAAVRLRQLFESIMDGYERHYPYMHLFIQEDVRRLQPDSDPPNANLDGWVIRFEKALMSIIEDGIDRGEFRDDLDPQMTMFAMLGSVNWSHRWFLPGGRFAGKELGSQFGDMFLKGVRAPRRKNTRAKP